MKPDWDSISEKGDEVNVMCTAYVVVGKLYLNC